MAANTELEWTGTDAGESQEGGARDDYLDGAGGDDHLTGGGGADTVIGGEGNDNLIGGGHDDLLIGGPGDDTLNGGGGSDIYSFNFNLRQVEVTETYNGGAVPLADGSYAANANGLWNSYLDALEDWRAQMTAIWGADADTSTETFDYLYGGGKKPQAGTATFDNTFTYTESELDAEGFDIVVQLNQGDKLQFNISEAVASEHMWTEIIDHYNDGVLDTQIHFSGEGSIVLLEQQFESLTALTNSGYVDFLL